MPAAPEVIKALEAFVDAFNAGDSKAMGGVFASTRDVQGIGSDPGEWWAGRDRLLSVIETQLREMAGARFEFGETAGSDRWVAAKCAITMPDGTAVAGRVTVVCTADGHIEHFHFSVGVANEDLIGQALTT